MELTRDGHRVRRVSILLLLLGALEDSCLSSARPSRMWVQLVNVRLRQSMRQDSVLPTGRALPELDPTQATKLVPYQAGANTGVRLTCDHCVAGPQASALEGGMTVSGPPRSRMTRPLGTGGFSWYW